jgi:hypothetical protein
MKSTAKKLMSLTFAAALAAAAMLQTANLAAALPVAVVDKSPTYIKVSIKAKGDPGAARGATHECIARLFDPQLHNTALTVHVENPDCVETKPRHQYNTVNFKWVEACVRTAATNDLNAEVTFNFAGPMGQTTFRRVEVEQSTWGEPWPSRKGYTTRFIADGLGTQTTQGPPVGGYFRTPWWPNR